MGLFSRKPMPPTPEERYSANKDVADQRRSAAAARYRKTGDSSGMWEEKSRYVAAARKVRDYDRSPAGRREARRNSR